MDILQISSKLYLIHMLLFATVLHSLKANHIMRYGFSHNN